MFVANIKLNKNKLFKVFMIVVILLIIILFGIAVKKVFDIRFSTRDSAKLNEIYTIPSVNYSNVLKAVHDNIDTYVGQRICFTGYVYRVYDFSENQFVLARDMIIDSNQQTDVVGFLCQSKEIKNYADKTWIEITGKIIKGDYHGDMPIIEVESIKQVEKPKDALVYPPSDDFVPTSGVI